MVHLLPQPKRLSGNAARGSTGCPKIGERVPFLKWKLMRRFDIHTPCRGIRRVARAVEKELAGGQIDRGSGGAVGESASSVVGVSPRRTMAPTMTRSAAPSAPRAEPTRTLRNDLWASRPVRLANPTDLAEKSRRQTYSYSHSSEWAETVEGCLVTNENTRRFRAVILETDDRDDGADPPRSMAVSSATTIWLTREERPSLRPYGLGVNGIRSEVGRKDWLGSKSAGGVISRRFCRSRRRLSAVDWRQDAIICQHTTVERE